MRRSATSFLATVAALTCFAASAFAAPNTGVYTSTDLGGQLLTGRASSHRTGIDSGLPHVLHAQSYNGTLGTQWELRCAVSNGFATNDLRDANGTGPVIYTSAYSGGQLEFFNTGGAWGDGVATLATTTIISTVQFVNFVPVASVVNGNTSGVFAGGCALTFGIGNGVGVGETTSLNPAITKPADYPAFLDATCNAASPAQQFGTWGTAITLTMAIDCATPAKPSTWGSVKTLYR